MKMETIARMFALSAAVFLVGCAAGEVNTHLDEEDGGTHRDGGTAHGDAREGDLTNTPDLLPDSLPNLASCPSDGVCAPGSTRTAACALCGIETDICASNCQWVPGACNAQGVCSPG